MGVPAYATWDLFGSIKFMKNYELRAGVTNLFNRGLPIVNSSQNLTDTAQYDIVGRSFYVGLKARF